MMISKQPCLQTLSKRNGDKATQTSKAQPARLTCLRTVKVRKSRKTTISEHATLQSACTTKGNVNLGHVMFAKCLPARLRNVSCCL